MQLARRDAQRRGRVAETGMEIKNCEQPARVLFGQTLVVERLFGSPTDCCVEQLQSVCSQPSPAAHPLLQ
jgi:hypothetical protein